MLPRENIRRCDRKTLSDRPSNKSAHDRRAIPDRRDYTLVPIHRVFLNAPATAFSGFRPINQRIQNDPDDGSDWEMRPPFGYDFTHEREIHRSDLQPEHSIMAKRKENDDLAAALNSMADGHDHGHDHDEADTTDETIEPVQARANSPVHPAPPPPPAPATAPPGAPLRRPPAPTAEPVAPPQDIPQSSAFDMAPPDDDDAVIVPPPDRAAFIHAKKPAAKPKLAAYQTLHFRQTIIPIMLTTGVMAIVLACIRLAISDDSIFSKIPGSVAAILAVIGLVLLAVAVMNMMQVKQILEGKK
jgi:hypothetical protein